VNRVGYEIAWLLGGVTMIFLVLPVLKLKWMIYSAIKSIIINYQLI